MPVDEIEVYVTRDGYRRAAIVRRPDGFFCIYRHGATTSWFEDENPLYLRYEDPNPEEVAEPEWGVYGTLLDARTEVRGLSGFSDAVLMYVTARALGKLAIWTHSKTDPDLLLFDCINEESVALPVGPERSHWAAHSLAREDQKIREFEELWQERALAAAARLVARYAWSLEARVALRREA